MLSLSFFINYLFSKRSGALIRIISWICLVGVTVGMASLIVVMSVMNGFNKSIRHKLLLAKPHLVIISEGNSGEDSKSSSEASLNLAVQKKKLESFHPGMVVSQDAVVFQDVVLRTMEGVYGGAIAKGVDKDYLPQLMNRLRNQNVGQEGSFTYSEGAAELYEDEVVLGLGLAKNLNVYEGDTIIVIPPESLLLPSGELPVYSKVRVKSLLQTELQDIDSQVMFYRRGLGLRALANSKSLSQETEVRLVDIAAVKDMKNKIQSLGFKVVSWEDRDRAMLFALKMEKFIIGTFIGLSTLITSFSILTVLVLLITQKRRDIGILMSMGLSKMSCRWLFVKIGLTLSTLGLTAGVALGLGASLVLDRAKLDLLPNIYYDTSIPISIEWGLVFYSLFIGGAVAFLGTYVPTTLTLRYSPSEALRAKV